MEVVPSLRRVILKVEIRYTAAQKKTFKQEKFPTKSPSKRTIKKIVETALKGLVSADAELSILFTDDEAIRELNLTYRSINKPTDVLSFPTNDAVLIGDVVVSLETARRQAVEYEATFAEELARLLVHGALHLVGYDHVNGGRQAAKMKKREEEIFKELREADVL